MRVLSLLLGVVLGLLVAGLIVIVLLVSLPPRQVTPGSPSPAVPEPSSPSPASPASPGGPSASPAASGGSPSAAGSAGVGLAVGQVAPPLVVPRLDGGTLDLSTLRGRPVWVNFMASWCPPCRDELPLMDRARRALDGELEIVAIDVREDEATARAFAQELLLEMPVGLDEDGSARDAWSAYAMPVHYWLDADGVIRGTAFGGIGPDVMLAGIRTVLPDADWSP